MKGYLISELYVSRAIGSAVFNSCINGLLQSPALRNDLVEYIFLDFDIILHIIRSKRYKILLYLLDKRSNWLEYILFNCRSDHSTNELLKAAGTNKKKIRAVFAVLIAMWYLDDDYHEFLISDGSTIEEPYKTMLDLNIRPLYRRKLAYGLIEHKRNVFAINPMMYVQEILKYLAT
jgi:hypothetical protein